MGATFGGEATGGNVGVGAFGAVIVEPAGAEILPQPGDRGGAAAGRHGPRFRHPQPAVLSTRPPMATRSSTTRRSIPASNCNSTDSGSTGVNLGAAVWVAEGKAGLPILNMLDTGNNLVHADINAVIAGPNADGSFPAATYPRLQPRLSQPPGSLPRVRLDLPRRDRGHPGLSRAGSAIPLHRPTPFTACATPS